MIYQALARRYRPARLAVIGRVYDPTPDDPYTVTVRPFMTAGILVTVSGAEGPSVERLIDTPSMDDALVDETVRQLIAEIQRSG